MYTWSHSVPISVNVWKMVPKLLMLTGSFGQELGHSLEESTYLCFMIFVASTGEIRRWGKPSRGVSVLGYTSYWLMSVSVSIRVSAYCLLDVTWASSQHGALRNLRPLRRWLGASSISWYTGLKLYSCVCNPPLEVTKHHKVTQICGTPSLSVRELTRPLHRWTCHGGKGYCSCLSLSPVLRARAGYPSCHSCQSGTSSMDCSFMVFCLSLQIQALLCVFTR